MNFIKNLILRYYVENPGKKPPTKNEVQLMIEKILAAKIKM